MMTSVTAKLLAIDQRLKALDPQSYNRWLIEYAVVIGFVVSIGVFVISLISSIVFLVRLSRSRRAPNAL